MCIIIKIGYFLTRRNVQIFSIRPFCGTLELESLESSLSLCGIAWNYETLEIISSLFKSLNDVLLQTDNQLDSFRIPLLQITLFAGDISHLGKDVYPPQQSVAATHMLGKNDDTGKNYTIHSFHKELIYRRGEKRKKPFN